MSEDNIFGLKEEPYYVWGYGYIYTGVQRALELEREQEKALLLPTEDEQQTELERIRAEALKTSWPIAGENKADYNYKQVYRRWYPENITDADYRALQDEAVCKPVPTDDDKTKKTKEKAKAKILSKRHLFRTLWKIWGLEWSLAGLGYFAKSVSDFTGPVFITLLITSIAELKMVKFVWVIVLLFVVRMGGALGLQYGVHWTMREGMQMRGVCALAVFEKILHMEPATRELGNLTNLQSVDAQAILDTVPFVHWVLIMPIALIFGTVYISVLIGWSAILGFIGGGLLMPLAWRLQKNLGTLEKKRLAVKDKRVAAVTDMLETMRVTKMIARETYWILYVQELREMELLYHARFLRAKWLLQTIMISIPILQLLIAFILEEIVFENRLGLTQSFEMLAMFSTMQMPLSMMGFMLMMYRRLMASVDRMNSFLQEAKPWRIEERVALMNSSGASNTGTTSSALNTEENNNTNTNKDTTISEQLQQESAYTVKISNNACFRWVPDSKAPTQDKEKSSEASSPVKKEASSNSVPGRRRASLPQVALESTTFCCSPKKQRGDKEKPEETTTSAEDQQAKEDLPESPKSTTKGTFRLQFGSEISIPLGDIVTIEGPVGSGKTAFLQALLGTLDVVAPSTSTSGEEGGEEAGGSATGADASAALTTPPPVSRPERIAYCPQSAWVMNSTIQENVVFGSPRGLDEPRMWKCLEAVAFDEEVRKMSQQAETSIGDRGIALSGGQKARLSLARALYSEEKVLLLDDPFAALDVHVSKHTAEQLVTFLKEENRTLIIVCSKTPNNIAKTRNQKILVSETGVVTCEPVVRKSEAAATGADGNTISPESSPPNSPEAKNRSALEDVNLMTTEEEKAAADSKKKEEKEKIESKGAGAVPFRFYVWLAAHTKAGTISMIVVALVVHTLLKMLIEYVIAEYGEQNDKRRDVTDTGAPVSAYEQIADDNAIDFLSPWWADEKGADEEAVQFIFVIGVLSLLFVLLFYAAAILLVQGTLSISKLMHRNLLHALTSAKISFYESTPVGRVLNRCSADFDVIDHQLPQNAESYFQCVVKLATAVVVISAGAPFFIVPMLLFMYVFIVAQEMFRPLARLLQRNAAADKSPVFSKFDQFLQGLPVLQAHGQGALWYEKFAELVDVQHQSYWVMNQGNRWWGVRLEALSVVLLTLVPICLLMWKEYVHEGLAKPVIAVVILYSMQMTFLFNWSVRMRTEFEAKMVSVERVHEYTVLPSEEDQEQAVKEKKINPKTMAKLADKDLLLTGVAGGIAAPATAVSPGTTDPRPTPAAMMLSFEDVKLRYRPHNPYALKGVNFQLPGGTSTAVVGRTGSGKSSLFAVLLRLVDQYEGKVILNGTDISEFALAALRGTYLAAVPQDPLLFSGPVRHSLVPSEMRKNVKIFVNNELDKYENYGEGSATAGTKKINVDKNSATESSGNCKENLPYFLDDDLVYEALETVGLKQLVLDRGGLDDFLVDPTATDLSFGQRQLLCVARALIKVRAARRAGNNIILISDEATSSLDRATDLKIQTVLSEEAKGNPNCCVLSIVHTLDSIIPCYSYVLTMQDGVVESHGPPAEIAAKPDSLFAQMLQKAAVEKNESSKE
ncbi:unnamed protein product [Amoebophrya sp. A120]|nr:unnamed protein product [Amoebophrya sp. A120]|eukprot:GSA120T00023279001.1